MYTIYIYIYIYNIYIYACIQRERERERERDREKYHFHAFSKGDKGINGLALDRMREPNYSSLSARVKLDYAFFCCDKHS